ncbi:hypothetical protein GGG16DRAFT_112760 [Schizophyllum commune]
MELPRIIEGKSLYNGFLLYWAPPRDMLDRGRGLRISPKFRLTCVNAPTPRKSVNALPSSPNVTDTGSSMILAASSFQAHDGDQRSADNVDNPRMLRKSVNDRVSSPNDAKTGKFNDFLDVASRAI